MPKPGDIVVLTDAWLGVEAGTTGVINGTLGTSPDKLHVTFNPGAFRDEKRGYVSCCNGPGVVDLPAKQLKSNGRIVQTFWRWKDEPREGGGEYYALEVDCWAWDGKIGD